MPTSSSPDEGESQPIELPVPITEAEREQLAHANEERHDWLARDGAPDRTIIRAGYQRRSDFEASTTDPDAALMALKKGGLHFGYHDHYAVDGGKARIILEVLVTPADVMENQPFLDMLWRACFRWQIRPDQVTGDTTYGTVENIVAVEDQKHPRLRPAAGLRPADAVLWRLALHLRSRARRVPLPRRPGAPATHGQVHRRRRGLPG